MPWQRVFPAPELASSRALSGPVVFLRRDILADIVVQALVYRPGLALLDFFGEENKETVASLRSVPNAAWKKIFLTLCRDAALT